MAESGSGEKNGEVASAIEHDAELKAMRDVLGALVPLKKEGRMRVLDYVLNRLGMTSELSSSLSSTATSETPETGKPIATPRVAATDIRSLKEQKQPTTANQMAALVAYYLAELAPEKRLAIGVEDIRTYFKEAKFPLPTVPEQTLPNAKTAGYFRSVGTGQYELNSVGYNLVVHKLPSPSDSPAPVRRRQNKKPAKAARRSSRG